MTRLLDQRTFANGSDRLERILRMVRLLRTWPLSTNQAVAAELGVSVRTVLRYRALLARAGYGPQLDGSEASSPRTKAEARLSVDEVLALLMAARVSSVRFGDIKCDPLASAVEKLLDTLTANQRHEVNAALSAFFVESVEYRPNTAEAAVFDTLVRALRRRKRLRLLYRNDETKELIPTMLSQVRIGREDGIWVVFGRSSWHRRVVAIPLRAIVQIEETKESDDDREFFQPIRHPSGALTLKRLDGAECTAST